MNNLLVAKPTEYVFKGAEKSWRWVWLKDIAAILGKQPKEVWARFFHLSKDVYVMSLADPDGNGSWIKAALNGEITVAEPGIYFLGSQAAFEAALESGDLLVSAGWSNDVLKYYRLGVREVVIEEIDYIDSRAPLSIGVISEEFVNSPVRIIGLDLAGEPVDLKKSK